MILAEGYGRDADYERGGVLAGVLGQHLKEGGRQGQRPCRSFLVADFNQQSKALTDQGIKSR